MGVAVADQTDVAEDQDVRKNEPEDQEGERLCLLVRTLALKRPFLQFDEQRAAIDGPSSEEGGQ